MRKRRRVKFTGRLKNTVSATSTERRDQALEIRLLKNLENKIIIRERTDRKVKVDGSSGKRSWEKRQKMLSAYVNNGSTAGECCLRRGCEIFPTHPHKRSGKQVWKRRQKQFSACLPRESCRKGRCDISFTHSQRERKRHVINLGGVKCSTHCTSVAEASGRPWGKCVTKATRSVPLLFTNKIRSNGTESTRHTNMSPQIEI